jgi:O-antigen/teichoic acid export membrane protein
MGFLGKYIFSAAFSTFLLQIALTALTFFTSLLVAWTTNDTGFGVYSAVFTWLMLFSLVALAGTDDLLMRQIPISSPAQIRDILHFSQRRVWFATALVALLLIFLIEIVGLSSFRQYRLGYYLGLVSIPAFAFMYQQQSALRAFRLMTAGQIGEKVVQPVLFILAFLAFYAFVPQISDTEAIASRSFSLVVAAILAAFLLRKKVRKMPIDATDATDKEVSLASDWARSCRYFMLTTLLYAVSTRVDVAMLDLYQTPSAEIAHYNAAARFADILAMPFMLTATIGAPLFAKLYKDSDKRKLQVFFRQITLASFALTAIGCIIIFFFGDFFLAWFGDNFKNGYTMLLILAAGKLIHAFVGPVGYLLMMANYEKPALYSVCISVVFTLALHLLFIPIYRAEGAAWATFGGLLVFEICQVVLLWRCLRLRPIFF